MLFRKFVLIKSKKPNHSEELSITDGDLRLDSLARAAILAVVFLLPIFLIPSVVIPFQFSKTILLVTGVFIALVLYAVARLKEGSVVFPTRATALSVWLLPIAYLFSLLFSNNFSVSSLGQSLDIDTFGVLLVVSALFYLSVILFKQVRHVLLVYVTLLTSAAVFGLFQLIRLLFGPEILSFGVLLTSTANLLGKWNDLGVFFGLIALVALSAFSTLRLKGVLFSTVAYAVFAISLFFMAVVNFFLGWLILGLFGFGFFVYSLFAIRFKGNTIDGQLPSISAMTLTSIIVVALAAIFLAFDGAGNSFSSLFGIAQIEARPSWQSTIEITRDTYQTHLVFGTGPNTFVEQWALLKPRGVNETVFWNTDFNSGIGLIPTSFITTGVVGGFAWIIFLLLFLAAGIKALFRLHMLNPLGQFVTLSSFLASVYLWIAAVFYIPNIVIFSLAFLFSGLFLATLRNIPGQFLQSRIMFTESPRAGFVAVFTLALLLLISVVGLYLVLERYTANVVFQRANVAFNIDGNLPRAESLINQAIALVPYDRYYRLAAEVALAGVGQIIAQNPSPDEQARVQFQAGLSTAIQHGLSATAANSEYYQNWLTLSRVYRAVVPLGISGAYESARDNLLEAEKRSPLHPLISFERAQLEAAVGNRQAARDFIRESLEKKNNYTDAIFLLSQVEIQEGNLPEAIVSAEAASVLAPSDPVVFFQLGLLRYSGADFAEAASALERAVALSETYSNARYFLGLSYAALGRNNEAIAQFERVEELNSTNQEVKFILENLRAGRTPFTGSNLTPPEDRAELPITE